MPGKPAARLTDMTAHGGTITGPGVPTVLIGKMPAATLGDMHVCPMCTPMTPPIPHVGGPISLGSTGVFIGKKPAARMGDMAVCVGPPSSIVLGCMTVLIGEAGSGSQAGPAPAAAAAVSASMTGLKAVAPMKSKSEASSLENHFIDVLVQDKCGKPLAGLNYVVKDPDGTSLKGATTQSGKIRYEGYAKAGSYEVQLFTLANAKWSASKAEMGQAVELTVDAEGFDDGEELVFHLVGEVDGKRKVWFESLSARIERKKAKANWNLEASHLAHLMAGQVGELTGITFLAVCRHAAAASGKLVVEAKHVYTFRDSKGRPLAEAEVEIETQPGKFEKKKTDKDGKVDLGKGRIGVHRAGHVLKPKGETK